MRETLAPRRLAALIVAATTVILLFPEPACACSCAPASDQQLFDRADRVFTARMVETDTGMFQNSTDATHVFEVQTVHKGSVQRSQEVVSASDSAACGLSVEPGEEYVVFASSGKDGLTADSCAGTRPADEPLDVKGAKHSEPKPGESDSGVQPWVPVLVAGVVAVLLAAGVILLRKRRAAG